MSRTPIRNLRRAVAALAVVAAITGTGAITLAAPAGAHSGCQIRWGSLPKTNNSMTPAPITSVRAGRHACYDRFVVELRGTPAPGWRIRYVSRVVQDGSGATVPLRGGAFIQASVLAPAYDSAGRSTFVTARPSEVVSTTGFRTFRQIAYAGSFEGVTQFGLGVRARLPFRVFVLAGPGSGSRLVIDVAHSWR